MSKQPPEASDRVIAKQHYDRGYADAVQGRPLAELGDSYHAGYIEGKNPCHCPDKAHRLPCRRRTHGAYDCDWCRTQHFLSIRIRDVIARARRAQDGVKRG